jgi:heme/copper-type cytochrome/quinol oxidase subunit 2
VGVTAKSSAARIDRRPESFMADGISGLMMVVVVVVVGFAACCVKCVRERERERESSVEKSVEIVLVSSYLGGWSEIAWDDVSKFVTVR